MDVSLTPSQMAVIRHPASRLLFTSGRAAGKSFVGTLWAMLQMIQHPGSTGLLGANVPRQLNNVVISQLVKHLDQAGIAWRHGCRPPWAMPREEPSWTGILSISNGSMAYCRSMHESGVDNNVRGLECGWIYIDEARDLSEDAFDIALACLRGQQYASYKVLCTSTPNGFNWLHDRFVGDGARRLPDSDCVRGRTRDNSRRLPPGFEETLRASYSQALASQELDGEFCELSSGRVFSFDRQRHCKQLVPWPEFPIILSADQNVQNASAIIMQVNEKARQAHVLEEILIPDNATTQAVAREFARRWGGRLDPKQGPNEVWFWCDPSSMRRDTRGGQSDFVIMEQELRNALPNARIRDACDRRRRPVHDGVNAINCLLDPTVGEPRLFIAHGCHELIADLERLQYLEGTRTIDKSDKQRSHFGDCLRYPISELLPVMQPTAGGFGDI